MSQLTTKQLNADRDVKAHLLNVDSTEIARKLIKLKREKGIDIRIQDGKLVSA